MCIFTSRDLFILERYKISEDLACILNFFFCYPSAWFMLFMSWILAAFFTER